MRQLATIRFDRKLKALRKKICALKNAGVAELADALDSKSSDRKIVWVRAPPPAITVTLQSPSTGIENSVFTDWRASTIIVNTPRIVPNGTKMHSIQATTNANQ